MTVSKSMVQRADLDALEREMRSLTANSQSERGQDDMLAELAKKVGRQISPPASPPADQAAGRRKPFEAAPAQRGAVVDFRPRPQTSPPDAVDLDLHAAIKNALEAASVRDGADDGMSEFFPDDDAEGAGAPAGSPRQSWPQQSWQHPAWERPPLAHPSWTRRGSALRRTVLPLTLALAMSAGLVTAGYFVLLRGGLTLQPSHDNAANPPAEKVPEPSKQAAAAPAAADQDAAPAARNMPSSTSTSADASAPVPRPVANEPGQGASPDGASAAFASLQNATQTTPVAAPTLVDTAPQTQIQSFAQAAGLGMPHQVQSLTVGGDAANPAAGQPMAAAAPAPQPAPAQTADAPLSNVPLPPDNTVTPGRAIMPPSRAKPVAAPQNAAAKPPQRPAAVAAATGNKNLPSIEGPPPTQPTQQAAATPSPTNTQLAAAAPETTNPVTAALNRFVGAGKPPAPPSPAPPVSTGPKVSLKLASSTSEKGAEEHLTALKSKFPGLLDRAAIRKENMGRAGVFYRVRLGPLSRDEASKLCTRLKAGGGSCQISG